MMADWPPIPLAALVGLICAMMLSFIPGPLNLTILNEGAQRGFKWAALIGFGASVMEAVYCAIAFTGFSSFFDHGMIKATMEVLTFVFLLFLGFKFLSAQSVEQFPKIGAASQKIEARLEKKLHPHSAFSIGFVRVMGNLGVLLFWIVLAANLMAHDWVADNLYAKAACIGGVMLGMNLWFCGLSFAMSRGYGRFSEKTLLKLEHFSGLCLIGAGLFDGGHIIWQLAKHKI
ncbi:MAG TPA: LysE family transporter [Verrucomicrobiae bacterium]|nr:LysE family transporter [Verrucomicrobiae bacterium]